MRMTGSQRKQSFNGLTTMIPKLFTMAANLNSLLRMVFVNYDPLINFATITAT